MKKYTLKRIITSLFTLLAILLVLFILMQLMPGSPFNDEKLTADMRAALYAKYGLDQPIYIQFFRYVGNMLRGDFGVSYTYRVPVATLIEDIADGVYVTELIGQGVNGVTGDYSRGAAGFRIERGEITGPVAEFTIAGNLKDMFRALTPANDLEFRYGVNVPTLRVDGMTVAGG